MLDQKIVKTITSKFSKLKNSKESISYGPKSETQEKIASLLLKNFDIAIDIRNDKNYKKDYKNIESDFIINLYPSDKKFLILPYPINPEGDSIAKRLVDDLHCKIFFPKDY